MAETTPELMPEPEYRALVQKVYDRIEAAFDAVDPDQAECEGGLGQLTITLPGGARWILSRQPPVRQIWLAVASIGRAYHFSYDTAGDRWVDDKGEGLELLSHLARLLREEAGLELSF